MDEGEGVAGKVFEILGETAAAIEPGEGALDDPASRQNLEPPGLDRAFDDFWFDLLGIGLALVELRYKSAPPHIRSARARSRTHIPHSRA